MEGVRGEVVGPMSSGWWRKGSGRDGGAHGNMWWRKGGGRGVSSLG